MCIRTAISRFVQRINWAIEHVVATIVAVLVTFAVSWLITNWQSENVVEWTAAIQATLANNLVVVDLVIVIILISWYRTNLWVLKYFKLGRIADKVGLCAYYDTQPELDEHRGLLKKYSSYCSTIKVIGATGKDMFCNEDSPLHEAIRDCISVEVILMSPDSDNINRRASALNETPDDYRQQIFDSINYLQSIADKDSNTERVKLKFYNSSPSWRYIILDTSIWIQRFPKSKHIQEAACYAFEDNKGKGLYTSLVSHFGRLWSSQKLKEYDFINKCLAEQKTSKLN